MKNTGKCPKCGGTDIRMVEGFVGAAGTGNNLLLGLSIYSGIPKNTYVCCDCGYTEEWINEGDIERVRNSKKAKRV